MRAMILFFVIIDMAFSQVSIFEASKSGNLIALSNHIEKIGVDIESRDANGYTPLFYAVEYDQHNIIDYLIIRNANVNATNARYTLLQYAIEKGKKSAKQLIENGANINNSLYMTIANWDIKPNNIMEMMFILLINGKHDSDFISTVKLAYNKYTNVAPERRRKINPELYTIDVCTVIGDLEKIKYHIKKGGVPNNEVVYKSDNILVYNYLCSIGYIGENLTNELFNIIENNSINIFSANSKKYESIYNVYFRYIPNSKKYDLHQDSFPKQYNIYDAFVSNPIGYALNLEKYSIFSNMIQGASNVNYNIYFGYYTGRVGKKLKQLKGIPEGDALCYVTSLLGHFVMENDISAVKLLLSLNGNKSTEIKSHQEVYIDALNKHAIFKISLYDLCIKNNYYEIADLLK